MGAQRQSPRGEMPAARRGERALLLQLALLWCPLLAGGFGDDEDAAGASLEPLCDDKGGLSVMVLEETLCREQHTPGLFTVLPKRIQIVALHDLRNHTRLVLNKKPSSSQLSSADIDKQTGTFAPDVSGYYELTAVTSTMRKQDTGLEGCRRLVRQRFRLTVSACSCQWAAADAPCTRATERNPPRRDTVYQLLHAGAPPWPAQRKPRRDRTREAAVDLEQRRVVKQRAGLATLTFACAAAREAPSPPPKTAACSPTRVRTNS